MNAEKINTFELSGGRENIAAISDFEINFHNSPPLIQERLIYGFGKYVRSKDNHTTIEYKDAAGHEGELNVFICHFKNGRCNLHIFGRLGDESIHVEREIFNPCSRSIKVLNEKIRYVLLQSRNILKTYYNNSSIHQLTDHLLGFFLPLCEPGSEDAK